MSMNTGLRAILAAALVKESSSHTYKLSCSSQLEVDSALTGTSPTVSIQINCTLLEQLIAPAQCSNTLISKTCRQPTLPLVWDTPKDTHPAVVEQDHNSSPHNPLNHLEF
ncbi:hypothetical protein AcV7_006442 [Taiwanofungus camphoratus]|nr:hypothetical protein AcV7_006442 [Antrodia cinnamomea]